MSLAEPRRWVGGLGWLSLGQRRARGDPATNCSHPIAAPRDGARPFPEVPGAGRRAAQHGEPPPDVGEKNTVKRGQILEGSRGVVGSPSWVTWSELELLWAAEPG